MNRTVFAIGLIFLLICVSGVSSNVNISKISYSRKSNNPPYPPSNPYPPDGYTNVSIYPSVLRWTGGDPDGDTVRYDLYYGITFPPPLLFGNTSSTQYVVPMWDRNTTYYWKIVARDEHGASTTGPNWSFTTRENHPPINPTIAGPRPKVGMNLLYTLNAVDPEDDNVSYLIEWGDGTSDGWTDYSPSGTDRTFVHKC